MGKGPKVDGRTGDEAAAQMQELLTDRQALEDRQKKMLGRGKGKVGAGSSLCWHSF